MEEARARQRALKIAVISWATIGVILLLAGAWWVLARISGALSPFLLAAMVVLILRLPVDVLERRGVPRGIAVAICYVVGLAVMGLFFAIVVPILTQQILDLINDFPRYYEPIEEFWLGLQGRAEGLALPEWLRTAFEEVSSAALAQIASWGRLLANGLVSVGKSAAGFVFDLIMALIIGFWALKDMPVMREEVMLLVGERRRGEAEMIASTVFRVLAGYVRGQFIVSAVTGTTVVIGLSILGLPYAIALGVITGLLNVVPYIGPFVGAVLAAIVGAFVSPWLALGAIAVVIAGQQLTDWFVTPKVMSDQVDLHPVLVILSLLVGGSLFGFWGLILGIPVAAVLKGMFVYYYEKHTKRVLGTEEGALFKSPKTGEDTDACECPPVQTPSDHSSPEHTDQTDSAEENT